MPRVSAIICVLDGETYLDEAIRSVVGQQGLDDWELLIVDDGSTDDSPTIAKSWAARDSRITCLEHPGHENRGLSASRNLGLASARGEYVAFLDADDVWLPEKFAYQTSLLDEHPEVQVTYGPSLWWWSWSGAPGSRALDHLVPLGIEPGSLLAPPELFRRLAAGRGTGVPTMGSLLIRRVALEAVGGFEESFGQTYEDQVLYTKMGLHMTALVTGRYLDLYRQHADSICARAQASGDWHPYLLSPTEEAYLEWLVEYLDQTGHGDEDGAHDARQALRLYRDKRGPWVVANPRWRMAARARLRSVVNERIPSGVLDVVKRLLRPHRPVDLGDLDRTTPVIPSIVATPGPTIEERWEHDFVERHRDLLRGRILLVGSALRLPHLGTDATEWLPGLTVPTGGSGSTAPALERGVYDCIVACDVLQGASDPAALLEALHDALTSEGHLLLTVPGLVQRREDDRTHPRWGFSSRTIEALLNQTFEGTVEVEAKGNALAAVAVLHGLPAARFTARDLDAEDPSIEVLVTAMAGRR